MKKKIAITGASGFLGKYLVYDLIKDENLELYLYSISLTRLMQAFPKLTNLHFIETDYSYTSLKKSFTNYHSVVHLAAKRMIPGVTSMADYSCNVIHTENLLHACDDNHVEVVVFTSSISVYDSTNNSIPFREDDLSHPKNAYGASKLACENLSSIYKTKMVTLRLSQLIGWGEKKEYLFSNSLERIKGNEPVTLWGEGGGRRDYLYTSDAVAMIKLAIEKKQEGIYNVGSGSAISFKFLIETMVEVFGDNNSIIRYDKTKVENKEISTMSIEKVNRIYGWKPSFTLKEAFLDMKSNPIIPNILFE
jgi:UDP-glucose 4-epimerase